MKKSHILGLIVLSSLCLIVTGFTTAQSKSINFEVNIREWFDLDVSATTLTFTDTQPTDMENPGTAELTANEGAVTVKALAILHPKKQLQLTVIADGDLINQSVDGTDIGIGAISWEATGDGYQNGTLATSAVQVGLWGTKVHHSHEGLMTFKFARDYVNQEPAVYKASITYTLSSI